MEFQGSKRVQTRHSGQEDGDDAGYDAVSYATQNFEEAIEEQNFVQSNPMMDRLRSTLREQLLQTLDRVKIELVEQTEALRESKREREDAGIELYGMQQQLSRLHGNLKSIDERYEAVSGNRVEGQNKVIEAKEKYAKKLVVAEELRKESAKGQDELDAILEKIRHAKRYNEAMKSEVAVTRTVANKAKEDLKARAKDKLSQDSYIDSLNTQVTRLEDEIALTEAQLRAQKQQSAESNKMIRETSGALDKLASEQRRLVQQWNSSVVALGRRDQALSEATKEFRKVQNSIKDLESENKRLKRDMERLQETNASMSMAKDRLDNEIAFTESTISKVHSNLGASSVKFEMLQETLKNTIQEEKEIVSAISKIESEKSAINHKCELLIRERHTIEEKIASARHEQVSMTKAAQNLAKEEKSVLAKIHDKEIESATLLNEIARLDIDRLNTQTHNSQLEDKLKVEVAALNVIGAQTDAAEEEIRHCNFEIEKKTIRVANLNREYNKMVEACDEEEPLGPLEATIKSLTKEIEQESSEIRSLQREWLLHQTELIETIGKTNDLQDKDSDSTARLTILRQKLLRLVQEIHTNESSLKSIESSIGGLHTDITRLNDLIEQNTRYRLEHVNTMALTKMEFERELVELEEQSTRLETQIVELKSNRKKMFDEANDTEAQIRVWEKEIQVEKDTQVALHSSKDAVDTKGMEKEIQRMKHRLHSLARIQEQLLRDMELAIHKREDISVKYKNSKFVSNDPHNNSTTRGELEKKVQRANAQASRLEKSIDEASVSVVKWREEHASITKLLEETNDRVSSVAKLSGEMSEKVDATEFEKNRLTSMCDLQSVLLKMYESLSHGELPPVQVSARTQFEVEKQFVTCRTEMDKITNIITGLALKFNEYEEVFDRMNVLASDVLTSNE